MEVLYTIIDPPKIPTFLFGLISDFLPYLAPTDGKTSIFLVFMCLSYRPWCFFQPLHYIIYRKFTKLPLPVDVFLNYLSVFA